MRLTATHAVILLIVVLILFGANRLPGLARSVGQSLKIFKNEVKDLTDDGRRDDPTVAPDPVAGQGTATDVPPSPPPAPPAPPRP
jgi:sec-independent protein translocase protein TatA